MAWLYEQISVLRMLPFVSFAGTAAPVQLLLCVLSVVLYLCELRSDFVMGGSRGDCL